MFKTVEPSSVLALNAVCTQQKQCGGLAGIGVRPQTVVDLMPGWVVPKTVKIVLQCLPAWTWMVGSPNDSRLWHRCKWSIFFLVCFVASRMRSLASFSWTMSLDLPVTALLFSPQAETICWCWNNCANSCANCANNGPTSIPTFSLCMFLRLCPFDLMFPLLHQSKNS